MLHQVLLGTVGTKLVKAANEALEANRCFCVSAAEHLQWGVPSMLHSKVRLHSSCWHTPKNALPVCLWVQHKSLIEFAVHLFHLLASVGDFFFFNPRSNTQYPNVN